MPSDSEPAPDPDEGRLRSLAHSYKISRAIQSFAELGGPDLLGEDHLSAADLSERMSTPVGVLRGVLLLLAAVGVLDCHVDGASGETFALSRVGGRLREGPMSLRRIVVGPVPDRSWAMWGRLTDAVRSGQPIFPELTGQSYYEYLDTHPVEGQAFYGRTARANRSSFVAVAWDYDFGSSLVVDVGGGLGGMMTAILDFNVGARGVVYDRAELIARLADLEPDSTLARRAKLVVGDFFESVPAGADVYLLSTILNNWPDDQAVEVLTKCREAMGPKSRVLVIEELFGHTASIEFLLEDLQRQLVFGGRMRTLAEHEVLLGRSGLRLVSVIPTWSTFTIIEAARADA